MHRPVRGCLVVVASLGNQNSLLGTVLTLLKKIIVSKTGCPDEHEIVFSLNINIKN